MTAQLAGFPKELNKHFTDDIDVLFTGILLFLFISIFGSVYYFQSLPQVEMTEAQLQKYLEIIYQVKPEAIVVQKKEEVRKQRTIKQVEEVLQETQTEKKERQKAQRAARQERREQMQVAARSKGIFAVAGAMKAGGGSGGPRGRGGKTLSGGGLGGVSVGGLSGIATGTDIAKVEKLRGGGAVMEGGGDIDVTKLSLEDIDLILEGSTVDIEGVPEITGAAASEASRSQSAIRDVVLEESSRLTACYKTQKKKDINLRGKAIMEYTITADGTVQRVRVKSSEWSNPSLGRRVESCLQQRIARWKFSRATDEVTLELPLLFK